MKNTKHTAREQTKKIKGDMKHGKHIFNTKNHCK